MLTIDFVVSENDYLSYFLYRASQSTIIKERRKKGWILIVTALTMFAFICYTDDNMPLTIAFGGMAILYLFIYPNQAKNNYKSIIKKQTLPLLKYNFDKPVKIVFNDSDFFSSGIAGETKIYHSAIEAISETGNHFFIYIKTGNAIIIPKFGLSKIEAVEKTIEEIAVKTGVPYKKDLDFSVFPDV